LGESAPFGDEYTFIVGTAVRKGTIHCFQPAREQIGIV
jgi:hypothetical protein